MVLSELLPQLIKRGPKLAVCDRLVLFLFGLYPADAPVNLSGKPSDDFVNLGFLLPDALVDRAADKVVFHAAVPHGLASADDLLVAVPGDAPVIVGVLKVLEDGLVLTSKDLALQFILVAFHRLVILSALVTSGAGGHHSAMM